MNARLRKLTLGFMLMGGAFLGTPMRPEDIETFMSKMSETKIVVMAEREDDIGDDPTYGPITPSSQSHALSPSESIK